MISRLPGDHVAFCDRFLFYTKWLAVLFLVLILSKPAAGQAGQADTTQLWSSYQDLRQALAAGQLKSPYTLLQQHIQACQAAGNSTAEIRARLLLITAFEDQRDYDAYFYEREQLALLYRQDLTTHREALGDVLTVNLNYLIYLQRWDQVAPQVEAMRELSATAGDQKYYFRGLILDAAAWLRRGQPEVAQKALLRADSLYVNARLKGEYYEPNFFLVYTGYLYTIGDLNNALAQTERGIDSLQSRPLSRKDSSLLSSMYNNLGVRYFDIGDYEEAVIHYRNALAINDQLSPGISTKAIQMQLNLSLASTFLEDWSSAQRQLDLLHAQFPPLANLIDSITWLQVQNYRLYTGIGAKVPPERLLPLIKPIIQMQQGSFAEVLNSARFLGQYAAYRSDTATAINLYLEGLARAEVLGQKRSVYSFRLWAELIQLHLDQGNLLASEQYLQQLEALFTEDDAAGFKIDEVSQVQVALIKGQLLRQKARTGQLPQLEVWAHYQQTDSLLDNMRQLYASDISKQLLAQKVHVHYEHMIETALALFSESGQSQYLDLAYQICQKSKAGLLLEGLNNSGASSYAGIPDQLLREERRLRTLVKYYRQEIGQLAAGSDSSRYRQLSKEQFQTQEQYQQLIDALEQEYPDYYALKYQPRFARPSEIQMALAQQQKEAYVEYFMGQDKVYAFYITPDDVHVVPLGVQAQLSEQLVAFLRFLQDAKQQTTTNARTLVAAYAPQAHALYQLVLEPVAQATGGQLPAELIISPDGPLGYLPIEALISRLPEPNVDFSQLDYLLRSHTISYSYSGSVWLQNLERSKQANRLSGLECLAFAPGYMQFPKQKTNTREDLLAARLRSDEPGQLAYSLEELNAISKIYPGTFLSDSAATESQFARLASSYRLIHLAMHGYANAEKPMLSRLLFSPDQEEGNLFAYELTNLRLNADLVVLSACESGIGKYMQGEGIMSLARSFMYAGAPSVVMTLWKIEDNTTATLMASFYENLSNEMPKAEAIRAAKLRYLRESYPEFANPFYWSGFVLVGETGTLEARTSGPRGYHALYLLLLLPVALLVYKRRRGASQKS